MTKSGPNGRQKAVSRIALLGALVVSAGILVLAYEEYWILYPTAPFSLAPYLSVQYQLDCLGYALLCAGVLLMGASWTTGRSSDTLSPVPQSVFERYRTDWGRLGVRAGTVGYLVVAIGLLVEVIGDAGTLENVNLPYIGLPEVYPVSYGLIGIGIAIWGVGAYARRVSSGLHAAE